MFIFTLFGPASTPGDVFIVPFSGFGQLSAGAGLGGGCRECAPLPEMKLSSLYIRIRF